ncbi:L,D-transpeptidase family protein [Comamonas sp. NLF-1-9]|uniref:L,D-transpeptidase family protein n=1 Tax=Comamonas sp. NLF-1-9 TaxID=2853163 RepID=UPI002105F27C|nr:L,D-transpeptidase family protein [Comamonas sp. NLF-1-9]
MDTQSLPAPGTPAAQMYAWIMQSGDHGDLPFVIIDKRAARIWIYRADGKLAETSPVLLGIAIGDESVPGIGLRPLSQIKPEERTTPAGRFLLEAGYNTAGESIFWIDYDAAVSLHRVRRGSPGDRRLHRLATPTEADNRISYGCVNMPVAVYNRSIHPLFIRHGGYAYVLPEVMDLRSAFPTLAHLMPEAPRIGP